MTLLFIVEGHAAVRNSLRLLLNYAGWNVQTFADSAECIAAVLQRVPDCIVSDLCLPALNAMAIQRAMQAGGIAVPMVALTDCFNALLNTRAEAAGINEVLDKPCNTQRIEAAMKRAMLRGSMPPQPQGAPC